jgi:hypothetical protein
MDLKEYRDGLYATDAPDRLKSIELLLIRIVDALDMVMLRLDSEVMHTKEGRALQNIASALDKLTATHIEISKNENNRVD